VRTVLLPFVMIPILSATTKEGTHDHDTAGIASAGALTGKSATGREAASRLEKSVILYLKGILDRGYRTLAAPCNGFFIFETQGKGTLNDVLFILDFLVHRKGLLFFGLIIDVYPALTQAFACPCGLPYTSTCAGISGKLDDKGTVLMRETGPLVFSSSPSWSPCSEVHLRIRSIRIENKLDLSKGCVKDK